MKKPIKHTSHEWFENSSLFGENAPFIEGLYDLYCVDPNNVSIQWQEYFKQIELSVSSTTSAVQPLNHSDNITSESLSKNASTQISQQKVSPVQGSESASLEYTQVIDQKPFSAFSDSKQGSVLRLINAYRVRGHQTAKVNPIQSSTPPLIEDLSLAFQQLTETDLDYEFDTGSLSAPNRLKLSDIISQLKMCYTQSIGSEYMHITDTIQKRWIQQRIEAPRPQLSKLTQVSILERLIAADGLESFLHKKYVGQKRFSLEGGESLIPALDHLINHAGAIGIEEMVVGMAHRGRLNVLVNILGKSPADLFKEFEGNNDHIGAGDVKYHKGYSSDLITLGKNLHLVLAFNPSHLEIVSPVVHGSVRARQQRCMDTHAEKIIPIIIHGDSAFSGQGVVMETFQMSQSRGYATGGTIHFVVNNQIGFTTSHVMDTRSTPYSTDVAKMVQAPIFHVNGDDPEAVIFITQLALDYRQKFKRDIVIDIICYRRHGHNEADEPACTQPKMYQTIRQHKTTKSIYADRLIQANIIKEDTLKSLEQSYRKCLETGTLVSKNIINKDSTVANPRASNWRPYVNIAWDNPVDTTLSSQKLRQLADKLQQLPTGFELHPRVKKIIEDRQKMSAGALPFNWGGAEILAYATLLDEGFEVRISGQDSGRGTFFHRHSVLHNQHIIHPHGHLADTNESKDNSEITHLDQYLPLQHLSEGQPRFLVIDSLLSEEAVLAYEYGYATANPNELVIWEAQFGDFANGAQVVIDQFISSGEEKWQRLCGLVMFLPHGYEGQGAEHSSARLERYLQLCADNNIQVCIPSTPAQLFHLLRRQMIRPYRKPLICIMPKSLLRHKESTSSLEDLYEGKFHLAIDENKINNTQEKSIKTIKRVILCSGKVYFDLTDKRSNLNLSNVVIIRIEQLYPFPLQALKNTLAPYAHVKDIVWCQEEPKNQGAWTFCQRHIGKALTQQQILSYAGRKYSAAPAVGSFKLHVQQQETLLEKAFKGLKNDE